MTGRSIRFWNALSIKGYVIFWAVCILISCAAVVDGWWGTQQRENEMDLRLRSDADSLDAARQLKTRLLGAAYAELLWRNTHESNFGEDAQKELSRAEDILDQMEASRPARDDLREIKELFKAYRLQTNLIPAPAAEEPRPAESKLQQAADNFVLLQMGDMAQAKETAQALRKVEERWWIALLACVIVLLGAGSTGLLLRVIRPVRELGRAAARFGEGDYSARAQVARDDEIGALCRTLNKMADNIQRDVTDRDRLEEALVRSRDELERRVEERTAELRAANKALQAEIIAHGRVEAALRESRERLRLVMENSPDAVMILDRDLVYRWVLNPFPGAPDDFIGKPLGCFAASPEDAERRVRVAQGVLETGQAARLEVSNLFEGAVRHFESIYQPWRDAEGGIIGLAGYSHDITERRQAEEALRRSETLMRAITDTAPDAVFLKDREGRILFANPAALAIVGKPAEQVIGKVSEEFRDDPKTSQLIRQNDQRIMNSDKMEVVEETVDGPAGPRTFLSTKAPYHDAAGRVIGLVGTSRDITERKRAENALRQREQLLQNVLDGSPSPIFLKDLEGKFITINAALERMLGISRDKLKGKTDYDIAPKEVADYWRSHDKQVMTTGKAIQIEELADLQDGHHIFLANKFPLVDADGHTYGVGAISHDITERKRADEALRESEERFRSTFNGAPIGMTLVSADHRILHANRAHCEFLGYSEQELIGKNIEEVTYPEDRKETSRVAHLMSEGGPRIEGHQKRYVRKNGEVVWGEVSVSVIRDAAGKSSYTIAQIVNITERRRAEQSLRESEARQQAIFENAPFDVWVRDRDGRCIMQNAVTRKHWGEQLGRRPEDGGLPADVLAHWLDNNRRAICGEDVHGEVEYIHEGERRFYYNIVVPFRVEGEIRGTVGFNLDITERKRAEEALRESEARFRSTFNDAPIGMCITSPDRRVLHVNRSHCEFLGYTEQELTGMSILDFTHPEDREGTVRATREMNEGGRRIEGFQRRYIRKDGRMVWGEVSVSAIRHADGKLNYTIAQIVNITERKRTEEALREDQETIRALLNATTDDVYLSDTAGVILIVNEIAARGWCKSVEQLTGACMYDFMEPAVAESRKAHLARCVESGQPLHFEDEHRSVWYDVGVYPIRDSQGKVTRLAIFARRITERKLAERALRESEQRYRELFEASPVALIEEDWASVRRRAEQARADGTPDARAWFLSHPQEALLCFRSIQRLDANKAALRLFKAASKKELLANFGRLDCDESRVTAVSAIGEMAAGNEFFEAETALRTLTGEKRNLLLSIFSAPGADKSLPRYIVSLSDVTDLRRAQQEAIEQRQAAQLQRMESLAVTGRLAAGVAHEINNPLQGIVAQLSLLEDELPERLQHGRRIELIHESIDRIAGIVRNLLQLHRAPAAGAESCAASPVVSSLTDMISTLAAKQGVRLEVSISPPEMTVPMAANALSQVLLNLALNAMDAMAEGGVIQIEAREIRGAKILSVSDTGVGIPAEHRSRLFSPFFTTKGPKGTGLGLSVTHSLVTTAGGTISMSDRRGGGTTFAIRFEGPRIED